MDLQEVGCGGMDWIELTQGQGQVAGTCECGNEPSVSVKFGEFLDQVRTGQFLKKASAPWSKWQFLFKKNDDDPFGPKHVARKQNANFIGG